MIKGAAAQRKRVLVVDDQEVNLRTIGGILRVDYDVSFASDGDQALARLEEEAFDLVLLDVRMPGRDGFEICQAIRAKADWVDIPIIFLSADNDKDLIVRALEAGGVDYITKPFNAAELVSRVRTHVALKVARDDLKQLAEDKDELLAILAHDLKNHLGGIEISAQALQAKLAKHGDDEVVSLAGNIHAGTNQMFAFVVDFLANCAVDHGFRLQPEPIWLDEISAAAIQHFGETARRKRITLTHQGAVTDPTAADPTAVTQMLHNLISNAVKFSSPGTTVRVSVESDAGGDAIWRIQDEGPGFSAEDKTRMFRRYERLSALPTADEPSTGLGLSIVQKLINAVGGKIECETEAGRGTTFTLRFPRFAAAAAEDRLPFPSCGPSHEAPPARAARHPASIQLKGRSRPAG